MEMKNECGDAQERIAMEEVELDPLRSPLPTGLNAWEESFMETMHKAKKYGWKLSSKQIEILDRIRADEEDHCPFCTRHRYCQDCRDEQYEEDMRKHEEATSHMTVEEIDNFNDYMVEVNHRDVQSGSYGNVLRYRGACPTWYDSSGYSNGRGYQVYVPR